MSWLGINWLPLLICLLAFVLVLSLILPIIIGLIVALVKRVQYEIHYWGYTEREEEIEEREREIEEAFISLTYNKRVDELNSNPKYARDLVFKGYCDIPDVTITPKDLLSIMTEDELQALAEKMGLQKELKR